MNRRFTLSSDATIFLALLLAVLAQSAISYNISFGSLTPGVSDQLGLAVRWVWLAARVLLLLVGIGLWVVGSRHHFFRTTVILNSLLTFGLAMNVVALLDALFTRQNLSAGNLLLDVLLVAVTNVLIFSIWYWIIDPPGASGMTRAEEPWEFLFPQRSQSLPHYEDWEPVYTDYVFLAFTTSLAFSPTDTLPLTRRAKRLMMLQATVSVVTIVVVAGIAVNAF